MRNRFRIFSIPALVVLVVSMWLLHSLRLEAQTSDLQEERLANYFCALEERICFHTLPS